MAIGWLTALKLVPWGDVIEATPQAVKAARALLQKRKENQAEPTVDASGEVHISKAMLTQWRQEQVVALETIERLATTQMQLIAEIERLRQRQRARDDRQDHAVDLGRTHQHRREVAQLERAEHEADDDGDDDGHRAGFGRCQFAREDAVEDDHRDDERVPAALQ